MTISRAPRFFILNYVLAALVLSGGMVAGIVSASSQESKPWKVQRDLLGELKKGKYKVSEDVSGLACNRADYPKVCIIADDETQGSQIVILRDGELTAGDFIPLISNTFKNDPLELDAEGVTFADGAFYVIGSHGRPRHEEGKPDDKNIARAEATRQVFRIALPPDAIDMTTGKIKVAPKITGSSALAGIIKAQPKLTEWFDKALEDNGLTVEGIAAKDGKLYMGMRGPVLSDGKAIILEVPIPMVFEGQQGEVRLHELDLAKDTQGNPRGVRDLVPHMDSFLILAGPVNDPEDDDKYDIREGDYTVLSWSGSEAPLVGRFHLMGYGKKVKPEAILPLEAKAGSFRALVLFDGPNNGKPTPVQIELK
jgi:hypothetical protein